MKNDIEFTYGDYVVCIRGTGTFTEGSVCFVYDIMEGDDCMIVCKVNTTSLDLPYGHVILEYGRFFLGKVRFTKCDLNYCKGDSVILSAYFPESSYCQVVEKMRQYNEPFKVKKCSDNHDDRFSTRLIQVVAPDGETFELPPHFFVKVPEPNEVTKKAIEESREIMASKKVNISSDTDYSFIPENEVISVTVDGVKGFLIKNI